MFGRRRNPFGYYVICGKPFRIPIYSSAVESGLSEKENFCKSKPYIIIQRTAKYYIYALLSLKHEEIARITEKKTAIFY